MKGSMPVFIFYPPSLFCNELMDICGRVHEIRSDCPMPILSPRSVIGRRLAVNVDNLFPH